MQIQALYWQHSKSKDSSRIFYYDNFSKNVIKNLFSYYVLKKISNLLNVWNFL